MAVAMGTALLTAGAAGSMVAAPGLMFTILVAAAALLGAANLRLEPLHGGAFLAALVALYVFSGQSGAALWFTPAATLIGALFVGIAIVRVPQLGPRGVLIAGTGALAPLATIMALHAAQHGLAERLGAAGALTGLALLLGGVLALAAARRHEGPAALKLTAWVLAAAALACVVGAVALAETDPVRRSEFHEAMLDLMLERRFLPNTPCLVNAGKPKGQLAACFVLPVRDDLSQIMDHARWCALVHQSGGGTGMSYELLRPAGASVGGGRGIASGPVFPMIVALGGERERRRARRRGSDRR